MLRGNLGAAHRHFARHYLAGRHFARRYLTGYLTGYSTSYSTSYSTNYPINCLARRPMSSRVAACIIANEVLNGKTLDTNSNYLAKRCFQDGLNLAHIRVIPDDISIIADTVKDLSGSYDLVFTSGGIGPTHDDMTYESIAKAFGRPLVYHEPTMKLMKATYKTAELNKGQRRMAYMPSPDNVIFTPNQWVPLVQVENVLILPGVPRLFHDMLDNWFRECLPTSGLKTVPRIRRQVKTMVRESILAARLTELQKDADRDGIEIGSYPKMPTEGPSYVVLSLVGPASEKDQIDRLTDTIIRGFDGTLCDGE